MLIFNWIIFWHSLMIDHLDAYFVFYMCCSGICWPMAQLFLQVASASLSHSNELKAFLKLCTRCIFNCLTFHLVFEQFYASGTIVNAMNWNSNAFSTRNLYNFLYFLLQLYSLFSNGLNEIKLNIFRNWFLLKTKLTIQELIF